MQGEGGREKERGYSQTLQASVRETLSPLVPRSQFDKTAQHGWRKCLVCACNTQQERLRSAAGWNWDENGDDDDDGDDEEVAATVP